MLAVVVLDGVTDGLDGAAQAAGDAPADLGERAAADARQPAGPSQDVLAFVLGHLRETAAALDAVGVARQEAIDHRLQEAHLPLAVEDDGLTHQAELAPAADGLGRDVQLLADLLQGDDRLGNVLGRHRRQHLAGQGLHQQKQVVRQLVAGHEQVGVRLRAIFRDAPADELIRIALGRIDLGQQSFGSNELFRPASGRSEPNLLIRQLFQGRMREASHSHSFSAFPPGSIPGVAGPCRRRPKCGPRPAPASFSSLLRLCLEESSHRPSVLTVAQPIPPVDPSKTRRGRGRVRGNRSRIPSLLPPPPQVPLYRLDSSRYLHRCLVLRRMGNLLAKRASVLSGRPRSRPSLLQKLGHSLHLLDDARRQFFQRIATRLAPPGVSSDARRASCRLSLRMVVRKRLIFYTILQ